MMVRGSTPCLLLLVVTCLLMLTGCASSKPQPRLATFNPDEYAPFANPGTGRVTGQAFMVQAGGTVVVAAGRQIFMNPVTSFSTEWFERTIIGGVVLEAPPAGIPPARVTVGDAEGRFTFDGLPPGDYYVATHIQWLAGTSWTGGTVGKRVTVRNGAVTEVLLTR